MQQKVKDCEKRVKASNFTRKRTLDLYPDKVDKINDLFDTYLDSYDTTADLMTFVKGLNTIGD
jgi:hypothetical protein